MKSRIRMSAPWVPYVVRAADGVAIVLAGYIALHVRRVLDLPIEFPSDLSGYYGLISIAAMLFAALPAEVYRSWRGSQIPSMLAGVGARWAGLVGVLLLWLFTFKASEDFSRVWFLLWAITALLFLWGARLGIYLFLRVLRRKGFNLRHVVLVGSGAVAQNIKRRLSSAGWSGYQIVLELPQTDLDSLASLETSEADEIWLALSFSEEQAIKNALYALRHSTASIRFAPDLFALRLVNHGMSEVLGMPMYDLSTSPMTGVNQLVKWLEDKLLSSLILLLISPLMLILALGVKLSSSGPIFYRQERVGLNNRPFNMLKFRSMHVDAEKDGVRWGGAATKTTTRFGQFLRRTSLDELPQFINVLKGDMSIVGPRPERPLFVEQFKEEIPDYMKKHLVKAGITGWAQVNGWRGDTDLKTRIEYDLYYIENWSLWFDIKIILLTIFKGFVNKHAY